MARGPGLRAAHAARLGLLWTFLRGANAQLTGLGIQREEMQRVWSEVAPSVLSVSDGLQSFCGQRLDHFDDSNTKTWCQRYVLNRTYFRPGGPVFICLDGEDLPWGGSRKPYTLACNNMVQLAPDFGAMVLALEHRYYSGAAFDGVPDFSTENLKYHSSRLALADLESFHDFIVKSPGFDAQGVPWVVFGGSYSGSLSAWARQLYPTKFAASVASSAPLKAQVNFRGYLDVVASALAAPSVGGSPECLATVSQGHEQIGSLLQSKRGRRALEQKFHLCGHEPLEDPDNIAQWAGNGVVSTIPQYNSNKCNHTSCNMRLFCGNLSQMASKTASASALDALLLMKQYQDYEASLTGSKPGQCTNISFQELVINAYNVTKKVNVSDGEAYNQFDRLWYYQTCTEFGWYQTCEEGSNCPFTKGYNTLAWMLKPCELLFGITKEEVEENIRKTNEFYHGSVYPNTTRTIFPNGEVDPWHWESILVHPNAEIDTLFVKGASHCQWMHAENSAMSEHLRVAKKAIQNKIASWLKHPPQLPQLESDLHSIRQRKFLASPHGDAVSQLQLGVPREGHSQVEEL